MSFTISGKVYETNYYDFYSIAYYKPTIVCNNRTDVEVKMLPLTEDKKIIVPQSLAEDVLNGKCKIYEGKYVLVYK